MSSELPTWVSTIGLVVGLSWFLHKPEEQNELFGNSKTFSSQWCSSVTSNESPLNAAYWPFSLMLTMHVLNSAGSSGGHWASDLASSAFAAFGSLFVKDLLAGSFGIPFIFANNEALLALVAVLWYLVNHNVPFTETNVCAVVRNFLRRYLPIDSFMDLCTLAFQTGILIDTAMAAGTAGENFAGVPAVGATLFTCVVVHAASEFVGKDGLRFNLAGCSAACERATWVAVWCATDGLANFPVVGGALGGATAVAEDFFGGRANFLMSTILLDALAGELLPFQKPHTAFAGLLYQATGVSNDEDAAAADDDEPVTGLVDLADPNINLAATLATCFGLSFVWSNGMATPNIDSITDGSLLASVTSDDKPLHAAYWPFSFMLTMHVLNSTKSTGGHWASDLVSCVFSAFGALMMKDVLAGSLGMPIIFANNEALLTLVAVVWYLRNHNLPFTDVNVWDTFRGAAGRVVPLDRIMNLCSLAFQSSILIGAATSFGTAGTNFFGLPALGAMLFTSVALHCSGDFLSPDGLNFNLAGCSAACERAFWVCVWCGTNGLGAVPFAGVHIAGVTTVAEARFGGRASFLMTMILMNDLFAPLLKFERPLPIVIKALYKVTGLNNGEGAEDDEEEEEDEDEAEAAAATNEAYVTAAVVVGLSFLWSNGMALPTTGSLTDGSLLTSLTSDDKPLHAKFWPFSLMLTMHVLNKAGSSGGHWAADIVSCVFAAFSTIMMQDVLNGDFGMPCLFANGEALLGLLGVCWYVRNHNVPFTDINIWSKVSDFVSVHVPLAKIMDACTLAFELNILIGAATAAGTSGDTFYGLPAVGATIFTCVALHCSGEFLTQDGMRFSLAGCSTACERAFWVAIWCATDGLANFPVVGGVLGGVVGAAEGVFGGRANLIMSYFLLDHLFGHLVTCGRPEKTLASALYKFTGVSSN